MTKIPIEPLKWLKWPWNLENFWNTLETYKMTKISHKTWKWPKYLWNPHQLPEYS